MVGESGSGKSVTALTVMRLLDMPPARVTSGSTGFEGRELLSLAEEEMRDVRGKDISMIFQEPMTSLNPVYTLGDQIAEVFMIHRGYSRAEAMEGAADMLEQVGIPSPGSRVNDYPTPAFGRHASAGHDRHGPRLSSQAADRR